MMMKRFIYLIYQFWILTQGKQKQTFFFLYKEEFFIHLETSLALSFVRDLRNLTIIYKPNAFIYHLCQISSNINSKRIRWHYESLNNSDTFCQNRLNNSDCFDFFYGPSTSVLVVKEPDMFMGKYTCQISVNSSYELKSTGWIDVKLPMNEYSHDEEPISTAFDENELGQIAQSHQVPFILDEKEMTSYGQRVELAGLFRSSCRSVPNVKSTIHFTWIFLRSKPEEKLKQMRFIHDDGKRILIENERFSSTLLIYSVTPHDQGDYICIASNDNGQSFSTVRSLIVSGKTFFLCMSIHREFRK